MVSHYMLIKGYVFIDTKPADRTCRLLPEWEDRSAGNHRHEIFEKLTLDIPLFY